MGIPHKHFPLVVGQHRYDLSHLDAFSTAIPGKGIAGSLDLHVLVCFSNHVFTKRTAHGENQDQLDHLGTKRSFDVERYQLSRALPELLRQKIAANSLTYVSKSFGGASNLIFIEAEDSRVWTIVYSLLPHGSSHVILEVLSSHPRRMQQHKISRKPISYFARMCVFKGRRIPESN